jgi:hypothetical protein
LIGTFSAYWGVRQTSRANEADRREKDTRQLLYKRRGIQLILGLSEATLTLHALIETGDRISLRREALKVAADLTRAVSFFSHALKDDPAGVELTSARHSLAKVVEIVTTETNAVLRDAEKEEIRRSCLEAIFNLQSIRGHLEMLDDLAETSPSKN